MNVNGEIVMEEKRKGGRTRGSKNVVTGVTKAEIASFFSELTASNYRWRQRVKRVLDGGADAREFRYWSQIALDRSIGLPTKAGAEKPQGQPLIFVSRSGYLPYDSRANPEIDERSRRLNAENDKQLALEAAQRAAPVVPEPEGEPELEIVPEPPR